MHKYYPFYRRLKQRTKILLFLLLFVLITVSGLTFFESQRHPTIRLPTPTGPNAVGRMEYDWTDQSRTDTFAPHSDTKRELVVWAWYPTQHVSGATTAPYLPQHWEQLSDQQHQNSDTVLTNSVDQAPLTAGTASYPVLIFEPGLGNLPTEYTTLIEDLASYGYVIFAITPTYSSDVVVFPDGRVVNATSAGKLDTNENPQTAANQLVGIWSQDAIFVMNQLDRLNNTPGNMWSQRLDLTHLGVFGHSFGGATAAEVCQMDARCKAGINLDGDLAGDVVQKGLTRPFLVIQHDMGSCSDAACRSFQHDIHAILHTIPQGESYHITIQSTEHFNFSDYAVRFASQNLRFLGLLGSIDGERGLQVIRAYLRAFFDKYLYQASSPLLEGPSNAYPEVQFVPD